MAMANSTISMEIFYVANCKRLPGRVAGKSTQWSHCAKVREEFRGPGSGLRQFFGAPSVGLLKKSNGWRMGKKTVRAKAFSEGQP